MNRGCRGCGRSRLSQFERQMPGYDAVAKAQRSGALDTVAVDQGSVLAAQVLDLPLAVDARQGQVLARQPRVIGVTKLIGARTAEGDAVPVERDADILAIDVTDYQFTDSHRRQVVSVTS